MQLVVVGTAPIRSADDSAGSGFVSFYPDSASMVDGLVAQASRHSLRDEAVIVCTDASAPAVRRAVRFVRQALRTNAVSTSAVRASPLRLAVSADRVERMIRGGDLAPRASLAALNEFVETSWSLVRHRAPQRLADPRPRFVRRMGALLSWSSGCTVLDGPVDGPLAGPVLRPAGWLPDDDNLPLAGACEITIADGCDTADLVPLVGKLAPSSLDELPLDPLWSGRWRSVRVAEVVVSPSDLASVVRRASAALREAGTCFWCGLSSNEPEVCPRCSAQRAGEPATGPRQSRGQVPAPFTGSQQAVASLRQVAG